MWQNVNNEVLFAWFKFHAKIPSCSGVCVQGKWQKYTPHSPPLFKDEGIKNIGYSMSIRNLIFGVNSVTVSELFCYNSLLQNATDVIAKCDSYFITKRDSFFFRFFITKCDSLITRCDNYYKMQRLLQTATVQWCMAFFWGYPMYHFRACAH